MAAPNIPNNTRVTAEQITEIRRLRAQGVLVKVIAYRVGVGVRSVCRHSLDLSTRRHCKPKVVPTNQRPQPRVYEHMETRP